MPLYEYKCELCGKIFEVMQRFSDEPVEEHAGCGGKVEKLISRSALHFKGTGWYVTDYARGKKPPSDSQPAAKSESSKSEPSKSESSKSESSKGESSKSESTQGSSGGGSGSDSTSNGASSSKSDASK